MMIMGSLAGDNVVVTGEGNDEDAAVEGIAQYLSGKNPVK